MVFIKFFTVRGWAPLSFTNSRLLRAVLASRQKVVCADVGDTAHLNSFTSSGWSAYPLRESNNLPINNKNVAVPIEVEGSNPGAENKEIVGVRNYIISKEFIRKKLCNSGKTAT